MQLMPQLAFDGQCRQAFEHYARILNGKITVMNSFGENRDKKLPPGSNAAAADKIRFAELEVGDHSLLGNDLPDGEFEPMRGFNVALHAKDVAEARRIFDGLAEGGCVNVPLTKVSWSPAFGMLTDRFGTPWLILALSEGGSAA